VPAMVGRAWEDVLLQEREENKRLKVQQKEQAEREEKLARRLVQLKEMREALLEGKSVGHSRDGKIRELREKIDDLSRQHRELRAKLELAKREPKSAAAGKRAGRPGLWPLPLACPTHAVTWMAWFVRLRKLSCEQVRLQQREQKQQKRHQ
jgi:hypothetical protein